jgi:hypothetical protein
MAWKVEYVGGFYLDAIARNGPWQALLQPVSLLLQLLEDAAAGPLTGLLRSFHNDLNREWGHVRNPMDPLSAHGDTKFRLVISGIGWALHWRLTVIERYSSDESCKPIEAGLTKMRDDH